MSTAFLAQSTQPGFGAIRSVIADVLGDVSVDMVRIEASRTTTSSAQQAAAMAIADAVLVIADVTDSNPNVMFELGLAKAQDKPLIVISADVATLPYDAASLRLLVYDPERPGSEPFVGALRATIQAALEDPNVFRATEAELATTPRRIFVSYSHRDKDVLDRLLVHLRPLERDHLVDVWTDTRIEAGADWKREVDEALRHASVAILLVTADFLASDFIVENELPPLLEQAETHGTRILPVIVKPCRYVRDVRLSRLQALNDPQTPLLMLTAVEQEGVLDEVAEAVERAMA